MTKNTLESARVAELLARLFAEAEESDARLGRILGEMPQEERVRRMSDPNADYRTFYGRVKEEFMAVSADTAKLLYMLARANGARGIVEFGTSFGVSTICLAAAVRDNGGGKVVGSELEPTKAARARGNLHAAGLDDVVEVREGDALQTLARDLPDVVDGVLLDGHKALYVPVLELVAPRLRPGAWLVADNADAAGEYLARVRAPGSGYASVAFAEDVELSVRL